ncbi:MAG: hypothetical protein AAGI50_18145 [Pseudomonadota bacterium]
MRSFKGRAACAEGPETRQIGALVVGALVWGMTLIFGADADQPQQRPETQISQD